MLRSESQPVTTDNQLVDSQAAVRHSHISCVNNQFNEPSNKPRIPRVQALADISCSALCCHSNETRAPIANLPNSAQLQGIPYHSPKLHPDLCSSVGMRKGRDTQTSMTNIHFASATPHTKCNDPSINNNL